MKLDEWMKKYKAHPLEFSKKIKCSRAALYNWRKEIVKPNKFFQKIIEKETYGEVTYRDRQPS